VLQSLGSPAVLIDLVLVNGRGRSVWSVWSGCELRQNWPMPILNKDMSLCVSLSGRPSNTGTRLLNYPYDENGLNFIYKAFATDDIAGAVAGVRALGIRGCSVSSRSKRPSSRSSTSWSPGLRPSSR